MKCTVTRKQDISVSIWSGGSTAQLFIYPPDASYANRNFEIRISSATVEEESSVFTHLPGYHRILMPLNAPLRLVHQVNENSNEVLVNPMEATEFKGDWHTTSHGICTDLGIMLAAGWQGEMKAVNSGIYASQPGFTGIYALADHVEIRAEKSGGLLQSTLMQGDFLLIESQTGTELILNSPSVNAAVLIRVFLA